MKRYWCGVTKDDEFITEARGEAWGEAGDLKSLELVLEDKNISIKLPKGLEYVQAKTYGADMSTGKCEVDSRYIGFFHKNSRTIIRVDEKTGNICVEVD